MKYVQFTLEEKAACFDALAKNFYEANFGTFSKSEIDLLMFHFYYNKLVKSAKNGDGTIDFNLCSDYRISMDLGIPQQRVRNLKVKNHLTNPIDFEWKNCLAGQVKNARYDSISRKITIPIPDPILRLEVEHYLEEKGAYVEGTLRSDVLTIRPEFYIELQMELLEASERKEVIKQLKTELKKANKTDTAFDERRIGRSLMESTADIPTIIANLMQVLTPGNKILPVLSALRNLF